MLLQHLLELISGIPDNSKLKYVRGEKECTYLDIDIEQKRINAKSEKQESVAWAATYLEDIAPKILENVPFNLSSLTGDRGTNRPVIETIIAHTKEFYYVRTGASIKIVWIPSKPKSSIELKEIDIEDVPKPRQLDNNTSFIPSDELILKVRNAFKTFLKYTNFQMDDYDEYITQFENMFNPLISQQGIGIDSVFQLIDVVQYKFIIASLEEKYDELSFLAKDRKNAGTKYMVWTTHRYYTNYLTILNESDFRANINNVKERRIAIVSSTLEDSLKQYLRAMRTKPFLLLAGISGTGKSRIVKQMAFDSCPDIAKLRKDPTSPGNYCLVEVKPNWHDSTELLGYESALNKTYVVKPFVSFLIKAMSYKDVPFFLCLDEMNLAPVEQYFAEFLSVLESRKLIDGKITSEPLIEASIFEKYDNDDKFKKELFGLENTPKQKGYSTLTEESPQYGEGISTYDELKKDGLRIPSNLIVIGTVNMDETTHQFSRKVIDRAMTIEMNIGEGTAPFKDFFTNEKELGYTDNPLPKEVFLPTNVSSKDAQRELNEEDFDYLKENIPQLLSALNKALNDTPFKIAYRVQNELVLYFAAYRKDIPEESAEKLLSQSMDDILMMKVLPRIEGDEDLLKRPLEELKTFTADYPKSKAKIEEMAKRFETAHFTSFWP